MTTPERAGLDAEILAWMAEPDWKHDEARFEDLALRLFAFQHDHCDAYARFCAARGGEPGSVSSFRDIPAVPTGAFKEVALRCFPEEATRKVFRTSGTSTDRRGELHLDTLALYEASLRPTLRKLLFPDLPVRVSRERPGSCRAQPGLSREEPGVSREENGAPRGAARIRVLAPAPREAPDSSLSHMFGCLLDDLGDEASGFDVSAGALDVDGLRGHLARACDEATPVAVCGTAFAFVHLVDGLAARGDALSLPDGSRVMETGGFKGRARELERDELYAALTSRLGVPANRIVNQYGMTELGSQFYDSVLLEPHAPRRKLGPPWVRVRIVDPMTGADVDDGELGMIVVHDLANTGSVAAIQTADLGRAVAAGGSPHGDGFEVSGRAEGAEARGCSIAADAMLAGAT